MPQQQNGRFQEEIGRLIWVLPEADDVGTGMKISRFAAYAPPI